MITSPFPNFDYRAASLVDGSTVAACSFCKKAIKRKPECSAHYESLKHKEPGFYQCPFGFTSRSFYWRGELCAATGVIAFPRFNSGEEREMAKRFPETRCTRDDVDKLAKFYADLDAERANALQQQAEVFPQAFHELRKLNAAVLQTAEKEMRSNGESRALKNIMSAAELIRNNFDILEALANVDGMRAMPLDSTINLFDLTYKTRCIYEQRAESRSIILVQLDGDRAIIRGSQKSFPIVPAVLIENAIKYGIKGSRIELSVTARGLGANLTVRNETDGFIDCHRCFDRGTRFSTVVEGSGFGLYLAKQIVDAHGGTIECRKAGKFVYMDVHLPLVDVMR